MPSSPDSSFIPKHGPVARKRKAAPKQVYVLTLVSYVLMFAALLASGGVFLYSDYIETQLNLQVQALDQDIRGFDEADMQKVIDFDLRLQQANARLQSSASVVPIFEALESVTIETVQMLSLNIERIDDTFGLTAEFETDTFDSVIFQRKVMNLNELISPVMVSDTSFAAAVDGEDGAVSSRETVKFSAEFAIPQSTIPYEPSSEIIILPPPVPPAVLAVPEADVSVTEVLEDTVMPVSDENLLTDVDPVAEEMNVDAAANNTSSANNPNGL